MSFNSNDNIQSINLGNYEEYFILYMDNELNDDQKAMVDAFLLAHPDLQAEFELLLSTRLSPEPLSLDKEALWSHSMKLNNVDEELLLYIDNELPAGRKKILELELASNEAYQLQYQVLMQARLDASETIAYPNKEELYQRTERVFAFKPWMRVAAAAVVIAAMGVFYFTNDTVPSNRPPMMARGTQIIPKEKSLNAAGTDQAEPALSASNPPAASVTASNSPGTTAGNNRKETSGARQNNMEANNMTQEELAATDNSAEEAADLNYPKASPTTALDATASIDVQTASFDPSKQILNTSPVTSALTLRNTIKATEPEGPKEDVASNNKGSFKGFLRKATRVIGRRTGIDPTSNGGEELLIGAVALKLN